MFVVAIYVLNLQILISNTAKRDKYIPVDVQTVSGKPLSAKKLKKLAKYINKHYNHKKR